METDKAFSISAKTCTLKVNSQEGHSTILGNGIKYVIPIYQREYSWKVEQIKKFLSDILASFWGNDGSSESEPMFIGTMQLSTKNSDNEQHIIDGQQRLTTFLILIKVLKHKYPACSELKDIELDWLSTQVNKPSQQVFLNEFINGDLSQQASTLNPYVQNARLILDILNEENNSIPAEDIQRFVKHLLSNVYFVVIETKAGLSKTLQIFNAINTTGLDLNGGDIFKIRMYEYMTDILEENESAFEKISNLYKKIADYNKALNSNFLHISEVLRIYQYIIIAKHNLSPSLYYQGVDTFFEGLFDTLLNVNQWEHFSDKKSTLSLSTEDIEKIIDVRYEWEKQWRSKELLTAEDVCAMHFIWWSRYSRYGRLVYVYLFKYGETESGFSNLLYFIRQLSKLFTIYSIRYQKRKGEIFYGFMQSIIDSLVNKSAEETIALINNKIGKLEDHKGSYDLEYFISENLTENPKRKGIICRLSAMLEEDYKSTKKEQIEIIRKRLFDNKIDIEHIQSFKDSNNELRKKIWDEWKGNINSIGNLMVLEQKINQSISNKPYPAKVIQYLKSEFSIVKNHPIQYAEWNLDKCLVRKEMEKQKMLNYLFN